MEEKSKTRKVYSRPALSSLGKIHELTKGSISGSVDGSSGKGKGLGAPLPLDTIDLLDKH